MVTSAFGACRFQILAICVCVHYYYYYYYFTIRVLARNFRKSYLLLLAKILRLLDVFRLLTVCAKTAIALGDTLLIKKSAIICDILYNLKNMFSGV